MRGNLERVRAEIADAGGEPGEVEVLAAAPAVQPAMQRVDLVRAGRAAVRVGPQNQGRKIAMLKRVEDVTVLLGDAEPSFRSVVIEGPVGLGARP